MKTFSTELAAAALRMSRSTPGVPPETILDAMTLGADLGISFALETM